MDEQKLVALFKNLLDERFDGLNKRLDRMDARFDGIDERLDRMDARLDQMDARLDRMDTRFDGIDETNRDLYKAVIANGTAIRALNSEHKALARRYGEHDVAIEVLQQRQ